MTGTSEVCEALDVATRTLSLFFDSADENVRAYEVLRAHRARLERLEAFVEAASTLMGCAIEFEQEWTDRYGDA